MNLIEQRHVQSVIFEMTIQNLAFDVGFGGVLYFFLSLLMSKKIADS